MVKELTDINSSGQPIPLDDWQAEHELDARGLYCPEPVMMLHNKIRDIKTGERMKLVATDPSTTRDVPKFCVYLNHPLVSEHQADGLFYYLIQKNDK